MFFQTLSVTDFENTLQREMRDIFIVLERKRNTVFMM